MPAPNHETVGFIDIGTNSVHLSVVRYYPETTGASVFQDKEMIRLGKGLYSEGSIGKDTIRNAALIDKVSVVGLSGSGFTVDRGEHQLTNFFSVVRKA